MKLSSLILNFIVLFQVFIEISGKYEIIMESIENLLGEEDQIIEAIDVRVRKFNRTMYTVRGNFRLKIPIGDDLIFGFKAFNMAGGQYKMLFERELGPSCKVFFEDHLKDMLNEFLEASNTTGKWKQCPLPVETIFINDWSPSGIGNYLPPYLPGGEKWKGTFYFQRDGKTIGGANAYAILRSEESLLRYGG